MSREDLLSADEARRRAMIDRDVDTLDRILGDDLVWTHSSGRTDDKQTVLGAIASGSVVYRSLKVDEFGLSQHGDVFVYHGLLNGRVSRDGEERSLRNRFLSVWRRSGSAYEMIAWQSTAC